MALEKQGYQTAPRGTTKVKFNINEDGTIVTDGSAAAGTKYVSINQANAANGLDDNNAVFAAFASITGGVFDLYSNKMTVTWSVT